MSRAASSSTIPAWAMCIGLGAFVLLISVEIWNSVRIGNASLDVLRSVEGSIEDVRGIARDTPPSAEAESKPEVRVKKEVLVRASIDDANRQAARDSAKAGVRAAGLGDLIVKDIGGSGENVVISGTAVGKSDSKKVIVTLKERRSKSGRANYSVVSVQPES